MKLPLKTNVKGIWVKPRRLAAAAAGAAAVDPDVLEPPHAPAVIEANSTFFWLDACASW